LRLLLATCRRISRLSLALSRRAVGGGGSGWRLSRLGGSGGCRLSLWSLLGFLRRDRRLCRGCCRCCCFRRYVALHTDVHQSIN